MRQTVDLHTCSENCIFISSLRWLVKTTFILWLLCNYVQNVFTCSKTIRTWKQNSNSVYKNFCNGGRLHARHIRLWWCLYERVLSNVNELTSCLAINVVDYFQTFVYQSSWYRRLQAVNFSVTKKKEFSNWVRPVLTDVELFWTQLNLMSEVQKASSQVRNGDWQSIMNP